MANIKGRGVRVEIGKTLASPAAIATVTQAFPAVAGREAHGYTAGTVGFFSGVTGMVNLEGQAVRVASPATDTFQLAGLDTTLFPAYTGGNLVVVTEWATVSPATSYSIGGGDAESLNATRLIDDIAQEEAGLLAAQSVSFNVLAEDVASEAMAILDRAAFNQQYLVFRITHKTGAQRIWYATPSLPGEDVQQGQLGTGAFSTKVKGRVLNLAAVA